MDNPWTRDPIVRVNVSDNALTWAFVEPGVGIEPTTS